MNMGPGAWTWVQMLVTGLPCDSNLEKTMVLTGDIRAVDWGKDIFGTYMLLVSYEWVR